MNPVNIYIYIYIYIYYNNDNKKKKEENNMKKKKKNVNVYKCSVRNESSHIHAAVLFIDISYAKVIDIHIPIIRY